MIALEEATEPAGSERWINDLLHDWLLVAEYDGGYSLLRCAGCATELVR